MAATVTPPYFPGDWYAITSGSVHVALREPLGRVGWLASVENCFSPEQVADVIECLEKVREIADAHPEE